MCPEQSKWCCLWNSNQTLQWHYQFAYTCYGMSQRVVSLRTPKRRLVTNDTGAIELRTTPKWSAQKVHLCNRKLRYWLCRRKRVPHLVTDEEFKDFCDEISCSKYQPCSEKEVLKQTLEMVAAVKVNNRRIFTK